MSYNDINRHHRDSRVVFIPDTHRYIVDGSDGYISVTALVSDCFEKFDAEYWSLRKGGTPEAAARLRKLWDDKAGKARDLGTLMHHRIEQYYLGEPADAGAAGDAAFRHFLAFAAERPLRPYRSEWVIFDSDRHLAGTLDFLAVNDRGEYEIYDWKRSTKVVDASGRVIASDRYGKCALAPLSHIPDTPFHHYALQLSLYRLILELHYGIKPVAAHLGIFHPDYSCHHVADVPYLRAEAELLLNQCR